VKEISIGEFARRSRLSLKALRLYDERGVLVPSRVDQASGYRYYDTAQLDEARFVVMMRELQLPLKAVKELQNRVNYRVLTCSSCEQVSLDGAFLDHPRVSSSYVSRFRSAAQSRRPRPAPR
jgi:DNA-binding transcriptional MerR regulator